MLIPYQGAALTYMDFVMQYRLGLDSRTHALDDIDFIENYFN